MFYDNLKTICDSKGVKITPLVAECGGAKGSISNWKKGASPNSDIVAKLAVRLNVSTDMLIFGFDSNHFSNDEHELLSNYRMVDKIAKSLISERAAVLAEMAAAKSNAVKIALKQSQTADKIVEPDTEIEYIYLDLPELSVSAGTGEYLHSDYSNKLKVPATNLTSRADYALRVHGDSMEPRFHDGDIVLVAADADVREGDIGIFILNGEGYIKEKGNKRLISLNNKYKDIKIGSGDTCICRGKVIGSL